MKHTQRTFSSFTCGNMHNHQIDDIAYIEYQHRLHVHLYLHTYRVGRV